MDMSGLSVLEWLYIGCAGIGGVLFVIRLVLMFMGGDTDADADGDIGDVDADGDVGDAGSDVDFKLLSLQGLTGFFMMFGLIGLAVLRAFDKSGLGTVVSMAAATAAGAIAVWVITWLFKAMSKLGSSGTLDMSNAVGQTGVVYLTIPASGRGKVQVTIQGRLRELEAVSEKKEELTTGERIKVASVVTGDILSVEKI